MAIVSSGTVSFLDLQNEFGGTNPITMDEYAAFRTAGTGSLISLSDYYGAQAEIFGSPGTGQYAVSQYVNSSGIGSLGAGTLSSPNLTFQGYASFIPLAANIGGSSIFLTIQVSSGTATYTNTGWTTINIWTNSTKTGTPIFTATRASGAFTSNSANTTSASAGWSWSGTYAYATYFGTASGGFPMYVQLV